MNLKEFIGKISLKWVIIVSSFLTIDVQANPDAKRLYDDLLSNYNRLIRPVSNNTDTVLVKLGLRLSQLIDLVSFGFDRFVNVIFKHIFFGLFTYTNEKSYMRVI